MLLHGVLQELQYVKAQCAAGATVRYSTVCCRNYITLKPGVLQELQYVIARCAAGATIR
jgi:hypothetical protein